MTTMINEPIRLSAGELSFTFLNSGDLYQATSGTTMLNQLLSNQIDGSLNNLYLRVHEGENIRLVPVARCTFEQQGDYKQGTIQQPVDLGGHSPTWKVAKKALAIRSYLRLHRKVYGSGM